MKLKLYLVSRTDNIGYDEFDSFIIAAESRIEARALRAENKALKEENESLKFDLEVLQPGFEAEFLRLTGVDLNNNKANEIRPNKQGFYYFKELRNQGGRK